MTGSKEKHAAGVASTPVDAVMKQNPLVDLDLLNKYRQSRRDLEELGCERKSDYRLSPALGGEVLRSMGRQTHG